ncbi:MAG: ATP-binding cassette domain-containing protein [Porticoccaceae bacterium]|nr:ATP-binding cassette domain-containing protein [Porticoccaceae bacterium]
MITLAAIDLRRGPKVLLEGAHLAVHPGQHIGIIGANGCGKSSLFKLLLGELIADGGNLSIPSDWRIAHMAQEVMEVSRSALDFVLDGDTAMRDTERAIAAAEAANDDYRLALCLETMDGIGGYAAEHRGEQLLHGLGFQQSEMALPVASFSGGWRIRLNLAQALMSPSELLLLDEPTNHLDLDATLWLEQWLRSYSGALLIISHDRDFLDNVVKRIVHIEQRGCHLYSGGYSSFERIRAERLALQRASYAKQQQRRRDVEAFVERFRYKASKARQAQSRLKELQRMQDSAPAHVDSPFYFNFSEPKKVTSALISLSEVQLGYADKNVLQSVDLELQPGMRIGLLGPNGAGKSTLIKGLTGALALSGGYRTCAEGLQVGYFSQHQLQALDLEASPLLHLQRLTPKATEQSIRDFLGGFDFHGDSALTSVATFSGGEKARLALAIVVWLKPNLLLLDEPTNHLDLEMRHALTMALQSYAGALVVISHDRHLLRNTVDELYLVADGGVTAFDGDLADYERWAKQYRRDPRPSEVLVELPPPVDRRAARQLAADARIQVAPLMRRVKHLEGEIEKTQRQLVVIQSRLSEPSIYSEQMRDELRQILHDQGSLKEQNRQLEEQWLGLQEQLEGDGKG